MKGILLLPVALVLKAAEAVEQAATYRLPMLRTLVSGVAEDALFTAYDKVSNFVTAVSATVSGIDRRR